MPFISQTALCRAGVGPIGRFAAQRQDVRFLRPDRPGFLYAALQHKRQAPVDAFKKYRKTCDPKGLFYTQYLRDLLEG